MNEQSTKQRRNESWAQVNDQLTTIRVTSSLQLYGARVYVCNTCWRLCAPVKASVKLLIRQLTFIIGFINVCKLIVFRTRNSVSYMCVVYLLVSIVYSGFYSRRRFSDRFLFVPTFSFDSCCFRWKTMPRSATLAHIRSLNRFSLWFSRSIRTAWADIAWLFSYWGYAMEIYCI